jgi:hypothetical protein
MKMKLALAALGAALTLSATPALAQYNSGYGGYRDNGNYRNDNRDYRNDYNRNGNGGDIIVSYDTGTFRFNGRDSEFRRLNGFGFRPGYRYQYTHTCNHYGCDVVAYAPGSGRMVGRFHAPFFANAFDNGRVPGENRDRNHDRDHWRS